MSATKQAWRKRTLTMGGEAKANRVRESRNASVRKGQAC
jgi:hypothetical protein